MNDDKITLRQIENKIDNFHKTFDIFKYNRDKLILHILKIYEEQVTTGAAFFTKDFKNGEMFINNNADALDMLIKWAFECCEDTNIFKFIKCDDKLLEQIRSDYYYLAVNYRRISDMYTFWSRNMQDATVSEDGRNVTFSYPEAGIQKVAYNYLNEMNVKNEYIDIENIQNKFNNYSTINKLMNSNKTISDNNLVKYKITNKIWEKAYRNIKVSLNNLNELPDNWEFSKFTLGEYKKFWYAFTTLATIQNIANYIFFNEKQKLPNNCILIKSKEEIINLIFEKTDLDKEKINAILEFITFNNNLKNTDIIWQPLIKLCNGHYAIPPTLVTTCNYERNLICLINKVEQNSYSKLSNEKERIMVYEISEKLKKYLNLKVVFNKKLPDNLPDIDIIIYDIKSSTLLVGEMKWLLQPDSVKELCARNIDLVKGDNQIKLVKNYLENNLSKKLEIISDLQCTEILDESYCVISKNTIGTLGSSDEIVVINENNLIELIDKFDGELDKVNKVIKDKTFYPKRDIDYFINRNNVEYGGYCFDIEGISFNNETDKVLEMQNFINGLM